MPVMLVWCKIDQKLSFCDFVQKGIKTARKTPSLTLAVAKLMMMTSSFFSLLFSFCACLF